MTASARKILHTLAIVVIWSMIDATIMDQIVTPAAFKLFGKYVYRKPAPGAGGTMPSFRSLCRWARLQRR